jgi:hypothetical protein
MRPILHVDTKQASRRQSFDSPQRPWQPPQEIDRPERPLQRECAAELIRYDSSNGHRYHALFSWKYEIQRNPVDVPTILQGLIKVLEAFAQKKTNVKPPRSLGAAVYLVAKLGGYLGRKNDPPPGHQIMWRGYRNLGQLCEGYQL